MNIRLHELELGVTDPEKSKAFYHSVLGLHISVDEAALKVFHGGTKGIDFNTSTHYTPHTISISFLTNDLQEIMNRLTANEISFTGPESTHLGMTSISFTDPDGYLIIVNAPTPQSPEWLEV